MSIRGLLAYKHRFFLSLLGITISVASIISLLTLVNSFKLSLVNQVEQGFGTQQIIVTPGKMFNSGNNIVERGITGVTSFRSSASSLTSKDVEEILSKSKTIQTGAPQFETFSRVFSSQENKTVDVLLTGTTPDYPDSLGYYPNEGGFLAPNDMQEQQMVVVLGQAIKTELFGEEPAVGKHVQLGGKDFLVIGVMPEKKSVGFNFDDRIYISVPVFRSLTKIDNAASLIFKAKSLESLDSAEKEIKHTLSKLHGKTDFVTIKPTEIISLINQVMLLVAGLVGGVAGISIVTGGIGIINVMLMSVQERTREIGLRKAVGASNLHILCQFITESILLSIVGCFCGFLLAIGCTKLIVIYIPLIKISIPLWTVWFSLFFALFLGVIFGIYPAIKATRISPIDALKYE